MSKEVLDELEAIKDETLPADSDPVKAARLIAAVIDVGSKTTIDETIEAIKATAEGIAAYLGPDDLFAFDAQTDKLAELVDDLKYYRAIGAANKK